METSLKLKIVCVVLAVICSALVPYTVVSVYKSVTSVREVYAETEPAEAILPEEDAGEDEATPDAARETEYAPLPQSGQPDIAPLPQSEQSAFEPLTVVNWLPVVLYDSAERRVYLPPLIPPPKIETDYLHNVHSINLSGNSFGFDRLYLSGGMVRSIDFFGSTMAVRTHGGSFAETVSGDGGTYVQLTDPKELYKTVVVIDPGHGGVDIGAPDSEEEIFEKDINLNIVSNLLDIFDNKDILLLPTRTEDVLIPKDDRAVLGNMMADYFISIHCNADETSTRSSGTVTYHFGGGEDSPITSEELAQSFQSKLTNVLQSRDRGVIPDGGYRVLKLSKIPAVIVELLFMTNPGDLNMLADPEVQMDIAVALKEVIEELPPGRP